MNQEKDSALESATNMSPNNRMHADSKKRRCFVPLYFFAAGDAKNLVAKSEQRTGF